MSEEEFEDGIALAISYSLYEMICKLAVVSNKSQIDFDIILEKAKLSMELCCLTKNLLMN